ncbi:MAG: tRNA 2-selenouridine(34) synthase MnmH [Saprospiraceae bacterium]
MAILRVGVEEIISMAGVRLIVDVRSPSEFSHASVPGAINLPLFTDEERAVVGTAYKQESRELAIKFGLDFFGLKMRKMVEEVESIVDNTKADKTVYVHCWRGGMRSEAVAWLLDLYGFRVYLLQGGYKAFRQWIQLQFSKSYDLRVLGGNTGSGKTYLLHEMQNQGYMVIDIEGLASHKGSAFGNIGMPDQPSQEMFENLLGLQLYQKSKNNQPIWVEDESQRIGHVNVPAIFWQNMSRSHLYFLDIPFEVRLNFLIGEYGSLDKERMISAISRIQKRLGGLETNNAIQYLEEGNTKESFRILLKYYDKSYHKSLNKKENIKDLLITIACDKVDHSENVPKIFAKI